MGPVEREREAEEALGVAQRVRPGPAPLASRRRERTRNPGGVGGLQEPEGRRTGAFLKPLGRNRGGRHLGLSPAGTSEHISDF